MSLIQYTSAADIRAALGVDDDELDDTTISLQLYEDAVSLSLARVFPDYDPEAVYAVAHAASSPTRDQKLYCSAFRRFVTLAFAQAVIPALPLLAPKSAGDNKVSVERFANNPYSDTIKALNTAIDTAALDLDSMLKKLASQDQSVVVSRPYFSVIDPDRDMVTDSQ